jgi:hypothetical protein
VDPQRSSPHKPFFPSGQWQGTLKERNRLYKKGVFKGKQTDQNAWVARVTINELKQFLYDFYGDFNENKYHKEIWFLYDFINKLDKSRAYALVADQE